MGIVAELESWELNPSITAWNSKKGVCVTRALRVNSAERRRQGYRFLSSSDCDKGWGSFRSFVLGVESGSKLVGGSRRWRWGLMTYAEAGGGSTRNSAQFPASLANAQKVFGDEEVKSFRGGAGAGGDTRGKQEARYILKAHRSSIRFNDPAGTEWDERFFWISVYRSQFLSDLDALSFKSNLIEVRRDFVAFLSRKGHGMTMWI